MVYHHLLAKMLKSHTLGWPAEENLISPSQASQYRLLIMFYKKENQTQKRVTEPPPGRKLICSGDCVFYTNRKATKL